MKALYVAPLLVPLFILPAAAGTLGDRIAASKLHLAEQTQDATAAGSDAHGPTDTGPAAGDAPANDDADAGATITPSDDVSPAEITETTTATDSTPDTTPDEAIAPETSVADLLEAGDKIYFDAWYLEDYQDALKLYQQAMDLGSVEALWRIGLMHENGREL